MRNTKNELIDLPFELVRDGEVIAVVSQAADRGEVVRQIPDTGPALTVIDAIQVGRAKTLAQLQTPQKRDWSGPIGKR